MRQVTAIPVSALKGENVVYDAALPCPGMTARRSSKFWSLHDPLRPDVASACRCSAYRARERAFRGYQGTVAGGSVKPGDSVVILPSGMVANVSKIVTFDLVRNAAVAGDAITLVLDRRWTFSRGDVHRLDRQPADDRARLRCATRGAAARKGIQPGQALLLKSGSRRQRVQVQPVSQLELKSGKWNHARTADERDRQGAPRLRRTGDLRHL